MFKIKKKIYLHLVSINAFLTLPLDIESDTLAVQRALLYRLVPKLEAPTQNLSSNLYVSILLILYNILND